MTFQAPLGLLLLAAVAPAAWLLLRRLRRRERPLAAFFLLRDLIAALPPLPRSFLLRRKLQALLFLAALACAGLAAAGPVLGRADDPPQRLVLVFDPLVPGGDSPGREGAWGRLAHAASSLLAPLRADDRVLLLRADTGFLGGGPLTPRQARRAIERERPALVYADAAAAIDLAAIAAQAYPPASVAIFTHFPERWRPHLGARGGAWKIVAAPLPQAAGVNHAILDVEVRPDFLRSGRIALFCRTGAFGPPGTSAGTAVLSVLVEGREIARRSFSAQPGRAHSEVFPALDAGAGLLRVELAPADAFPADNAYTAPLRAGAAVPVLLVSEENRLLEAALRALPGVRLTIVRPSSGAPEPPADVRVYDGIAPSALSGNLLVIAPPEGIPGAGYRGDALDVRVVRSDPTHFLLAGVALEALRPRRLPIYELSGGLETVASGDGHPLLAAGRAAGGARVALMAFDPRETGWSFTPSFPILVANLVAWLAESPGGARSSFLVGDALPESIARDVRGVIDPAGAAVAAPPEGWGAFRFSYAGRWRLTGRTAATSGDVFVNVLDERVSTAMGATAADPPAVADAPAEAPVRPFRAEAQIPLLVAAAALLLLEMLVAPRSRAGRLS